MCTCVAVLPEADAFPEAFAVAVSAVCVTRSGSCALWRGIIPTVTPEAHSVFCFLSAFAASFAFCAEVSPLVARVVLSLPRLPLPFFRNELNATGTPPTVQKPPHLVPLPFGSSLNPWYVSSATIGKLSNDLQRFDWQTLTNRSSSFALFG